MDLSKLSTDDLKALQAGDLAKVSTEGLRLLSGPDTKPAASSAYQRGREEMGGPARGLASVMQGPTFGFADEIGGAVGAVIDTFKPTTLSDLITGKKSFGDRYRENRDYIRGGQAVESETNPIFTALTQAAAAAPTVLASPARLLGVAATASRPVGVVGNTLRAAAAGAGYGAVSGLGNSTAEDLPGMALDTAKGAGTGAAVAGVLTPVQAAMGAGGRTVLSRLSETSAAAYAREKLAEALARDARGTTFTSGQANPLTQVATRLGKLGDDAVLADAAGKNTTQLLDTLATLPGRTKEQVAQVQRQRAATVGTRLRGAADEALGTNGQRLAATLDDLVATREAAAGPLYARLRELEVAPTEELRSLVAAAEKLGAGSTAKRIATAKQLPYTLTAQAEKGTPLVFQGSTPNWSMRDLDLLKQGLDDIIATNTDQAGKLTPFGKSVFDLKRNLVQRLDEATFDPRTGDSLYATARSAFAGPSALIDAANAGRKAVSSDEATIAGLLQGMGQSEREAFRVGAFEALRTKLGTKGGRSNIMDMWQEQTTREKLQAIFGDERSFREFASSVAAENVKKRLQSVGTGSQTAARQAGMGDLDVQALTELGVAANAASSGNVLTALGAARNTWNRVATPEPVRNELGRLLLSRGPEAAQNLNELERLVQRINSQRALRADGAALVGSQIGSRLAAPLPTN